MSDLLNMDALELSRLIAARKVTAVELMRATLSRINAVNGAVNAIVSLRDREALMGEARLADAMAPVGWLHGIPFAVKDLVAVRGVRSTSGSPLFANLVPKADDGLARRLRAAGAIIIGKTNVPAFGLGSHSSNPIFGVTKTPYGLDRTAGGSSGGAGAALAARIVSVADGSDMMGSLRNPAAWNNVYGFRPTTGIVPTDAGENVFQHQLSTNGPMARSVADMEALLTTLTDGGYRGGANPKSAPRIGWLADWGGAYPMETGVLDLAESAIATMTDLGWKVEPVAPPVAADVLWESWTALRSFAVMLNLGSHWRGPATRAILNPQALWEVEQGFAQTGDRVQRAAEIRLDWLRRLEDMFTRYDALMLPSTQCWPFPSDWDWPRTIGDTEMDTYHRWMECVVPASLAGAPALAIPAGFGAAGLPGGVQLIGPRGGDAALMALGRVWHDATGWPQVRPPVI